jgi:hypothetical protein
MKPVRQIEAHSPTHDWSSQAQADADVHVPV